MTIRILVSVSPGERRVAVMDGDTLLDFTIGRPGAPDGVGDVHRGRLVAHVPAMAGAFVALGEHEGFLPDSEGGAGCHEGEILTVRISRAAQGGKGPRLSARVDAVEGPVRLVSRGPDPLTLAAARHPAAAISIDDSAAAAALAPPLAARAVVVKRVFEDTLEAEIEALSDEQAALPGGMSATIIPTPALVAIDVDANAATTEKTPKARAQMSANLAAIPELARQIRLRNLSGAILIDFAGMTAKRRALLSPALHTALAADPVAPRLLGFTALGLAEILRPRIHAPLHEMQAGPHAAGLLALRQATRLCGENLAIRLVLRAAPSIVAALQADPVALQELAYRTTNAMDISSEPNFAPARFVLESRIG